MLSDGAFRALLLLISGVSAGIVLPPTNVTLSCTNLKVAVSWEYSKQQPQTSFRVHIRGSAGNHENETTDHQYDLSHFVWESEERYMGFHYVTVTATEGGSQSESVTSKTFTFNSLKKAHIKCELDFPPVDLNENDSGATVSFMNPLHAYRELEQAKKPDTTTFKFTVSSDVGDFEGACSVRENNYKHDVSFPEDVEKCVTLKGLLFDGSGVGQVVFRETGRICASKSTEVHVLVLVIILFILIIVISVMIIIICKVKAWTMKTPSPPTLLSPPMQNHREGVLRYAPVSRTDISAVTLTDNKPCKNPSVSSEEQNFQDDADGSDCGYDGGACGYDSRPPARSYTEGGRSEGYQRDDNSADDSVKTETITIDLEEGEVSPYDRPHTLQVDMGDGDMVMGYSER